MDAKLSRDLDAVRGLAALAVLLAHVNQWFVLPLTGLEVSHRYFFSTAAHFAVLIFFTLSGYVICHSLIINVQRHGMIDEGEYLRARALRVLPPFLFAFLLSLGIGAAILIFRMHGHKSFQLASDLYVARQSVTLDWTNVIATLLLSNGIIPGTNPISTNGPLWSLSIEVWLYGGALFLAVACQRRLRDSASKIAGLAFLGFAILMLFALDTFLQFALYWALGAVLRLRENSPQRWRFLLPLLAFLAIPGIVLACVAPGQVFPLWNGGLSIPTKFSILVLGVACFHFVRRFLPNLITAPFDLLAHSSYTLYIIHFPILLFLFSNFHKRFIGWSKTERGFFLAGITVGILLLAHGLAHFLEDRKRWGRYARRPTLNEKAQG